MSSVTVSPSHSNQQYWCHQCKKHISLRNPEEIICPDCQSEFIEEVEDAPQQNSQPFIQSRVPGTSRFGITLNDDSDDNEEEDDDETTRFVRDLPFMQQLFTQVSRNNRNINSNNGPGVQARVNGLNSLFSNLNNTNPSIDMIEDILSLFGNSGGLVVGGSGGTGFGFNPSNTFIGNPNDYFQGGDWQAFLNRMFHETSKSGPPPAAKSEIEKLKRDKADQTMVDQKIDCAVCKDEFKWGDDYIELPCEHKYHPDCIMPWLEQHNSCPVCRFELKTDDASYEEYKKEKLERERLEKELIEKQEQERISSQNIERGLNQLGNNTNNNSNNSNNNNNNDNGDNNRTTTTTTTTTTSPSNQRNLENNTNNEAMDLSD